MNAATISVSSYMHQSCYVQKILFSWSYPPLLALTIFSLPLLQRTLSLEERFDEVILLRTEYSKATQSLYIVQLWVFVLIPVC